MKDVKATGETFSTQKRTSSTSKKHEISSLFSIYVGPGSGSKRPKSMGIQADPDP